MKSLFALLLAAFVSSALAQRETGNGGFAHVCRDTNKKITSAQLMDLWESEELNTWSLNTPMNEQIQLAMAKIKDISPDVDSMMRLYLPQVTTGIVFTKGPLSNTKDAFPPYEPGEGCAYEQVARFETVLTETGKRGLRIYKEIYDSPFFSETDKAALMIHEAIYLIDRLVNDAKTSTRTRTLVAHLFSDSKIPNAVRMTFAKLISEDLQWSDEVKKPVQIWATPDPSHFQFFFGFNRVDGVATYDKVSPEQKEHLYRCTAGHFINEEGQADTGWVQLEKILSHDNPNVGTPGNPYYSITGSYDASGGGYALEPGQMISDAIHFSCTKKDKEGNETPVSFSGRYYGIGAECISISESGSVNVSSGENCMKWVESLKEADLIDIAPIEVVRSQPTE